MFIYQNNSGALIVQLNVLVAVAEALRTFSLSILSFCFPNVYLEYAESLTSAITNLWIDIRGDWV